MKRNNSHWLNSIDMSDVRASKMERCCIVRVRAYKMAPQKRWSDRSLDGGPSSRM
jgi:hypothetical protein